MSEKDTRREWRRKRRIRNQIIAYCVMLILVVAAGGGAFLGIQTAKGAYLENQIQKEEAAQALLEESLAQESAEAEAAVAELLEMGTEQEEETKEEYTAEIALEELVAECISGMTLEEKVAGLFFITPEQLTGVSKAVAAGDSTKEALQKYPVGGIIYFKQNIQDENQLKEMLANTASYSTFPIFLGVDEEGGRVARVASALGIEGVEAMGEVASAGDPQAVYDSNKFIGTYLSSYGFNVDFAPVADVLTNADNTSIGDRSFGDDPATVSQMVASAVQGLEDGGVSSCLKHFPGLGNAAEDTHEQAAQTDRTKEEMQEAEFLPFSAGIEAGVDMVMVGHISATELTGGEKVPASISEDIITGILRKELGYNGIVITDAMNMGAITEYYEADVAAIKALKAGADMVLMPEDFAAAYEGVLKAVQDGTISEERVNDSLSRIYRVKYADKISRDGI